MDRSEYRDQRWLQWRNVDTSDTPICPAYGCVEIVDYETVGRTVILQGRSALCFDENFGLNSLGFSSSGELLSIRYDGPNIQGAKWRHAFNGECSVNPGEIGHVTFDLPTWSATVDHEAGGGYPSLNTPLFMGQFYDSQHVFLIPAPSPPGAVLYTPGIAVIGARWRIGAAYSIGFPSNINPGQPVPGRAGNSLVYRGNEAGWNTFYYDPTNGPGNHRAWIGGARTFLEHPNRGASV